MRGLPFLGYRDYDPTIGRFTTPDPIGLAGGDVDVYGYCMDDPINFHDRTGLAGESQESKDKLAETVINEIISTKAPSVTASEEYKKGNVEGSGIPKSGKSTKSSKHAGADSVKRPSENKTTKYAGADKHGVPSQKKKLAGADKTKKQKEFEASIYFQKGFPGHVFIDPGDGTANGKYPAGETKAEKIHGKGEIRNETNSKFTKRVRIRVDAEQRDTMREMLDARSQDKDENYTRGARDCVENVDTPLETVKIKTPNRFFHPTPEGYIDELRKIQ